MRNKVHSDDQGLIYSRMSSCSSSCNRRLVMAGSDPIRWRRLSNQKDSWFGDVFGGEIVGTKL